MSSECVLAEQRRSWKSTRCKRVQGMRTARNDRWNVVEGCSSLRAARAYSGLPDSTGSPWTRVSTPTRCPFVPLSFVSSSFTLFISAIIPLSTVYFRGYNSLSFLCCSHFSRFIYFPAHFRRSASMDGWPEPQTTMEIMEMIFMKLFGTMSHGVY